MNQDVFKLWLTAFAAEAKPTPRKPVLLFLDNHGSHITYANMKHAKELNIEIFGLPPNTTSALQPLDVTAFGPLKSAWRKIIDRYEARLYQSIH